MKPSLWSQFIKWCGVIFDSISNFVSRNFGSNVGLAIFAFILSAVIIHVISERTGVEKEFTVPVKIVMNTKNTALSNFSPTEVKVSLKGSLEDLNVVDASLLRAEIVVRDDYASGQQITRRLYSTSIRNNGKLRVEDITPNDIDIVFDKEARYRVPVELPALIGEPLQGGKASVSFIGSKEVVVTGSELVLARLVEGGLVFSTRPIDVTNRSNSFERDVELIVPPDLGIKLIEPKTVKVAVMIELPLSDVVPHPLADSILSEGIADNTEEVDKIKGNALQKGNNDPVNSTQNQPQATTAQEADQK